MVKSIIICFFYSYDNILELNPNNNIAWPNKGDLLKELKIYDEAIEWLNL